MAVKAYTGRMGSGKTYEVVSSVILGALSRGRRVVSNIAGLNYPAFVDLLVSEGVPADKIGELVQIDHEEVLKPLFWRTDETYKKSEKFIKGFGPVRVLDEEGEPFIQPGDLVVLDEIWRFWEGFSTKDMTPRVMNFFRMHRHMTHPETGISCDIVLITQDVFDINRRIRAVIEETYYMEKLTQIGSDKRYRVDIFQGTKVNRRPLRSIQRTYEAKFFPLYKSHSQAKEGGAGPREENIDKRGNVLSNSLFKYILPLSLPVLGFAVWTVYSFFNPETHTKKTEIAVAAPGVAPGAAPGESSSEEALKKSGFDLSDRWRLVGYVSSAAGNAWVLSDGSVSRILFNPPAAMLKGQQMALKTPEGQDVTPWTGQRKIKEAMP